MLESEPTKRQEDLSNQISEASRINMGPITETRYKLNFWELCILQAILLIAAVFWLVMASWGVADGDGPNAFTPFLEYGPLLITIFLPLTYRFLSLKKRWMLVGLTMVFFLSLVVWRLAHLY